MQSVRKNKAMMSFTGRERVMAPVPQTQFPERGEKRFSKIKKMRGFWVIFGLESRRQDTELCEC